MSTTRRALALLMLLTAAACSSGGGGTAPPPAQSAAVDREAYARALAEWLCDDLAACCDGTGETPDRAACIAVKEQATLSRLASEENKSGRAFDPEMAATCVARLAETPASCGYERRVSECFRTYDGLRELGESCEYKTQCRESITGDVACVNGVCTERLAAGEACVDRPDDRGRCDVCRPDARCRANAEGESYCYAYEHRPRGVAGDPCSSEFTLPADPTTLSVEADCASEDGLYCGFDGRCTPHVPLGGSCTIPYECGRNARCEGGVCAAGLPQGEVCRSPFYDCAEGLFCHFTEVVCTDPSPVPGECGGYDLISGRCELPATEGQPCGTLIDCADGLFCSRPDPRSSEGTCAVPPSLCTTGIARLQRQTR